MVIKFVNLPSPLSKVFYILDIMEKKFQDVGKIDSWIERLLKCEYLTEAEVQELCVKVCTNAR